MGGGRVVRLADSMNGALDRRAVAIERIWGLRRESARLTAISGYCTVQAALLARAESRALRNGPGGSYPLSHRRAAGSDTPLNRNRCGLLPPLA